MATTTTTYGFATPVAGTEEDTWGALINANWDNVDDLFDGTDSVKCIRWETGAMAADDLDPDAENIQTRTMAANTTFTESFADGDWMVLHLSGGDSYTPTWPTISWVGGAPPTGVANIVIGFWKIGSTLYGRYGGSYS